MLVKISEDENHNKIAKPIAGATLGQGVPLGTWCSFEKDVAPSSNWLVAGSSFNANTYPALALYLGTNQVPYRYDHSRLGELENFTISTNSANPTISPYDGILYIYLNLGTGSLGQSLYVNGQDILRLSIVNSGYTRYQYTEINIKKGDSLYVDSSSSCLKARFYKHPLFIKATSIASDTDQQAILAQIQAYNTYSTEETLTGKTWIDGKPIYRKVIEYNGSISGSSAVTLADLLPSANYVDTAINGRAIGLRDNNNLKKMSVSLDWWLLESNTKTIVVQILSTIYCKQIILEYTKTTD